jgi:F0F1-type ATP synthase assembly protein I
MAKKSDESVDSTGEEARKSGLAYSAALALFASVVVLLGVGYVVDLYLNSSPWGMVIGIILGSVVGLYQFVRITNQIN